MNGQFKLGNIESVEATLLVTMNISQWRYILNDAKHNTGIATQFFDLIKKTIQKAEASYAEAQELRAQ